MEQRYESPDLGNVILVHITDGHLRRLSDNLHGVVILAEHVDALQRGRDHHSVQDIGIFCAKGIQVRYDYGRLALSLLQNNLSDSPGLHLSIGGLVRQGQGELPQGNSAAGLAGITASSLAALRRGGVALGIQLEGGPM